MNKLVILALMLALAYGCASKTSNDVATPATSNPSGYNRVSAEAANAFDELDGAPARSSGQGSDSYNRQTEAAAKAQNELSCEISGESCPVDPLPKPIIPKPSTPQPTIPEKPKPKLPAPVTIENKANPGSVADKAMPSRASKYPLVNGYPAWFAQPNYDGYLGGVGVAKPQKQGYAQQRRIATALAQADLARSVSVNVYNEASSERYLVDTRTSQSYQEKFSTMSQQDAAEYLQNPTVMDEWIDAKTGELYMWVVLPR